jgi:hypothetical protein
VRVATLVWVVLLAAGCGKVSEPGGDDDDDDDGNGDGGSESDAGGEPDADTPPMDAATAGCVWDRLDSGLLIDVNSTDYLGSPTLSGSGLALFFTVGPDLKGQADVFDATREAADAAFSAPRMIPELSSAEDERDLEVSVGGEEFFFLRGATSEIWTSARVDSGVPFGEVTSTGLNGNSPSISSDRLDLYFVDVDLGRIMRSSRAAVGEVWGDPVDLGASGAYYWIDISSDGLRVLLSGGGNSEDAPAIAIATRETVDDPFGEPSPAGEQLIGNNVTPLDEASWDGREGQMAVTVEYGNGNTDLYLTTCDDPPARRAR